MYTFSCFSLSLSLALWSVSAHENTLDTPLSTYGDSFVSANPPFPLADG